MSGWHVGNAVLVAVVVAVDVPVDVSVLVCVVVTVVLAAGENESMSGMHMCLSCSNAYDASLSRNTSVTAPPAVVTETVLSRAKPSHIISFGPIPISLASVVWILIRSASRAAADCAATLIAGVHGSVKLATDDGVAGITALHTRSELIVAAWYSYSTPSVHVANALHTRSAFHLGAALSYSWLGVHVRNGMHTRPDVRVGGDTWNSVRVLHFLLRRAHRRSDVAVGATDSVNPRPGSQAVVVEHTLSLVPVFATDSKESGATHGVPSNSTHRPSPPSPPSLLAVTVASK